MPSYKSGLYEMAPERWDVEVFEAMLIDDAATYVFDVDNAAPVELVSSEVVAVGYARPPVGSPASAWDATNSRWQYTAATLDFGAVAGGVDVAGVAVYRKVTDDTDSVLWTFHEFASPVATDGTTFTVTLSADGVARVGDA